LCVVGDDDQSIYRWRGADVRIIRGFRRDFPEALVVKLEQNYRSSKNIVRAALGIIEKAQDREPKELWTAEHSGEPVVLRACPDERAEAIFIANMIQKGRARGISSKEQAIFYRIHAQSRVLEEALRGANVPYQIIGGMKFFERAEIKDMLSYLRLVQNPDSDTDALRVINVPARGIGDKTISRLLDLAAENTVSVMTALRIALHSQEFNAGTLRKLASFDQLMTDLGDARDKLTPADLLERIITQTGYKQALEKDDSAESDARLENISELVGSLREYEAEAPETGESPTLIGYLERVSLVAAVDTLEDTAKVSLMTVHSAKGLEFEQVFLTGMEEETFPYRGLDGHDPEELDEERRLAYVAVTRARKELTISYAGTRFLFGRTKYLIPSRFLKDIPEDCVRREGDIGRTAYASPTPAYNPGFPQRGASAYGRTATDSREPLRSPGGRVGERSMTIEGSRTVDRDAFDDSVGSDFADGPSYEREPVVVRAGQKVKHKSFGMGVVERLESGSKPMVVARFPGHGVKRIVADFLEFL
jgi:DNA helicase-2/ATP-dependent DNA helicase PcrA